MKFDRPTPCKSMAGPSRMSLPMRWCHKYPVAKSCQSVYTVSVRFQI